MKKTAQRVPASKNLTMDMALKRKGYYDKTNNWNSLLTLDEYPEKVFRDRVEVLIFKGKNHVYLCREKYFYRVPGGSVERGVPSYKQAYNEAKQESHILIKDIKFSGIVYVRLFSKQYVPKNSLIHWDGVRNSIYTAQYDGVYDGDITPCLRDNFMLKNGKFYRISDVYFDLKPEYRHVIDHYQKNYTR